MSNLKKLMQRAAAGAAAGEALNVEDVFSTYLYDGTGATQTITNGIDLSGEGGLVWAKIRDTASTNHMLVDTERGVSKAQRTNFGTADQTGTFLSSFNSNGFTLANNFDMNGSGYDIASWTFRKAPKFFDVVTYTGDGAAGRTVSHNLGSVPGCIIVKKLGGGSGGTSDWEVYHRGVDATAPEDYTLHLNNTDARANNATRWNDTAPTSTVFTLGNSSFVNENTATYVAYLFAHNNSDGEFGPDADQDIIKCGSYTGNGSTDGPEIDLGWEPQWLLFKDTTNANDWIIIDNMRGMVVDNDLANADAYLRPNLFNQEGASTIVEPTPTGFKVQNNGWTNVSGANIIYIAIRRGPMAVPESATDVFDVELANATTTNGVEFQTGWPVDFAWFKDRDTGTEPFTLLSRLQGNTRYMFSSSSAAESTGVSYGTFDHSDGWYSSTLPSDYYSCMWRRAPNFFDVVAYTGNSNGSTPTQTLTHNLGVKPEMMWVKSRGSSQNWYVFHKDVWDATNNYYLRLNYTAQASASDGSIFPSDVTDTQFTVSERWEVNQSGVGYIAYLFASLDGVSKVGTFTLSGSSYVDVDCGFTSGARFVLVKCHSTIGNWELYDTERGITSGNDPMLALNDTAAESSGPNINPLSSGFSINAANFNAGDYIFYAIA